MSSIEDIQRPGFGLPLNYTLVAEPFPVILGGYNSEHR